MNFLIVGLLFMVLSNQEHGLAAKLLAIVAFISMIGALPSIFSERQGPASIP